MSAWAKVGVRCVCITEAWWDVDTGAICDPPGPIGSIYKIVSVTPRGGYLDLGLWGMPLGEVWDADGFRPLVSLDKTLEQDAETFRKIATHTPAPEKESAE